jgi:alkylation response protein AidB-like acyl-CoA dehydrogenase
MDFEIYYSDLQEEFRKEVVAWLDAQELPVAEEDADVTPELIALAKVFRRKLGDKGWYFPTWPKEYGGAGLTAAHAVVLNEELSRRDIFIPYNSGGQLGAPAIMVHGTEEQKKRFLPLIIGGQATTWQVLTEPETGSDLASVRTRGVRDGDDYVVNGSKQFIGSDQGDPDYLYTLINTNPEAARHENLSVFLIPRKLDGLAIAPMDLLGGGGKQFIFFDNVRVPQNCMVGQEGKGWAVVNSTLEIEHGGGGSAGGGGEGGRGFRLRKVIDYLKAH